MIAARQNDPAEGLLHDRYFTPEAYFAWEAQQLEKHELIHGRVYAMSEGTKNHSLFDYRGFIE